MTTDYRTVGRALCVRCSAGADYVAVQFREDEDGGAHYRAYPYCATHAAGPRLPNLVCIETYRGGLDFMSNAWLESRIRRAYSVTP